MIQAAILGFGVVGSGAAEVLTANRALIEKKIGFPVDIKYILDLREFPGSPFADRIVHDFNIILNDPEVTVVAEMMGGSHPAYDFTKALLLAGKSVVTSNKEVVANFGTELLSIAAAHHVSYRFEASVGGGIPIIRPLREDLASNHITAISGILNGTTNYILTRMDSEGVPFDEVLRDAQAKGYAERNPAADIEGLDATRKAVILAAMAFGKLIDPGTVYCEGITGISAADTAMAHELGCSIKLIGHTQRLNGKILVMVSPRLVPLSNPLGSVNGVFNGILVSADMVGQLMFYGPGAGKLPTASAVVSDIIDILEHGSGEPVWVNATADDVADIAQYACRRLIVLDAPTDAVGMLTDTFGAEACVTGEDGRIGIVTREMTEAEASDKLAAIPYPVLSRIRVL